MLSGIWWDAESFDEIWKLLEVVNSRTTDDGKVLIQFDKAGNMTHASCRKKIGKYKILSWKTWNGNGFGHSSYYYIFDTETNEVRKVKENYSEFTKKMMYYIEGVEN